jgi:hypothetical protein
MGKLPASSYRWQHHGSQQKIQFRKRSQITFLFLLLLGSYTLVTFLFVGHDDGQDWNATFTGGRVRESTVIVNEGRKSQESVVVRQIKGRQQLPTMPPRESSYDTAGFVHIGKTGGSTISSLLRNGCNSFESGPCRFVSNETQVSKLVVRNETSIYLSFCGSLISRL